MCSGRLCFKIDGSEVCWFGVGSFGYDEMIFWLNFLWLVTSGFHPTFVKVAFFRWF